MELGELFGFSCWLWLLVAGLTFIIWAFGSMQSSGRKLRGKPELKEGEEESVEEVWKNLGCGFLFTIVCGIVLYVIYQSL